MGYRQTTSGTWKALRNKAAIILADISTVYYDEREIGW